MPLPTDLAARLSALRTTDATPDDLRARVRAHLATAQAAAAADPFVDAEGARRVASACLAMLDAWPDLNADQRALVAAAAIYFAKAGDLEDDLSSIVGFDDDADVVRHVASRVGLPHLARELS